MKRILLMILFFGFLNHARAQIFGFSDMTPYQRYVSKKDSIDEVLLRVQYKVFYRETKEDNQLSEDMQALEIGKFFLKYSSNPIKYAFEHLQADILNAVHRSDDTLALANSMVLKEVGRYKSTIADIIRNYPEPNVQCCYKRLEIEGINSQVQGTRFVYEEAVPQIKWQLEDGDTLICGYTCQRASASFCGRTWKVWYSLELPYQEGPWKLRGLPGLILEAEDANADFHFTAIEIRQPKGNVISKPEKEYLYSKISAKRMEELIVLFYNNPNGYARIAYGEKLLKTMEMIGQRICSDSRTPCLIEKYE